MTAFLSYFLEITMTIQSPPLRSAANIKIAAPTDPMKRLRRLLDTHGSGGNKHEQATMLIEACIMEGLNTAPKIVGALRQLGFDPRHAAIVLKGDTDYAHRWVKDANGIYSLPV
ncbi:hypothetical protein [Sphingobium sp. CAP-1]|uniref:hypothetical protein n=1 Tax=Sphingobium sp. CAP-1 TaxID=2676077 RepID=UPI0012BB2AB7|nr:hypothetical protein [Sphingobium sp. CAP-1]QGP77779.1 hypothetical protein GL174_01285 [Sphingobium sp. CAP-1]